MRNLKSVALTSVLLTQIPALAQSPAPAPAPAPAPEAPGSVDAAAPATPAPALVASVTPYGVILGRFNLSDTQRPSTPEASLQIVRFGLKVKYGIAVGQIESQLLGNRYEPNLEQVTDETTGAVSYRTAYLESNRINIRRADAGINVPFNDMVTGQLSFGRIRPGAASAWGVSTTNATSGYAFVDGARVGLELNLQEGNRVGLGFVYGNALVVPASTGSFMLQLDGALKEEKAMVASVNANISGFTAAVMYGAEGAQPQGTVARDAKGLVASPTATFADVSHMEASLGYDMGSIAGGVYYEKHAVSDGKLLTAVKGSSITLGAAQAKTASSYQMIGLGMNGDSTLWGMTDLLQSGDKLIYGASYEMFQERSDAVDDSAEKDGDLNKIAVGFGYGVGGLTIELDVTQNMTKAKGFADKGEPGKKDSSTVVGIDTTYVF